MNMSDTACTTETVTLPHFRPLTIEKMRCSTDRSIDWLRHRYLARRIVSFLTSHQPVEGWKDHAGLSAALDGPKISGNSGRGT